MFKTNNLKSIFSKKALIAIILMMLITNCVSPNTVRRSRSHYKLAVSLIHKCQLPSALGELKKALRLRSIDPDLHHGLGLVYFQFKKYDKALKHLKKALWLKKDFTVARIDLARCLIETSDISKALWHLEQAKKDLTYLHPENIHAHLAFAYYKQGQFPLANKHFTVARKIKNADCITAMYHGRSLYFLNQYSKAIDIFERAKSWCVNQPPACKAPVFTPYFFASLAYHKQGKKARALKDLKLFLTKALKSPYYKEALDLMKLWSNKS